MRCDLIGWKIDCLNKYKEKIKKSCIWKKCKQQKEKCVWHEVYTLFSVLHTYNKIFVFLTNDKPVIKIVQYGIIFLVY